MNCISKVEHQVFNSLSRISEIKNKISSLKNKNFLNSMKIIVSKNKKDNLQVIRKFIEVILIEMKYFKYKLKMRKNKFDFGFLQYMLNLKNNKLLNEIKNIISINKKYTIIEIDFLNITKLFIQQNEIKLKKLNFKYVKCLKDLFRVKNENYLYLYIYYLIINYELKTNDCNNEYINVKCIFKIRYYFLHLNVI